MYLIFGVLSYYPTGGIRDLIDIFPSADDLSQRIETALTSDNDHLQIVWCDDSGISLLCVIDTQDNTCCIRDDMSLPITKYFIAPGEPNEWHEMPIDEWIDSHLKSRMKEETKCK